MELADGVAASEELALNSFIHRLHRFTLHNLCNLWIEMGATDVLPGTSMFAAPSR